MKKAAKKCEYADYERDVVLHRDQSMIPRIVTTVVDDDDQEVSNAVIQNWVRMIKDKHCPGKNSKARVVVGLLPESEKGSDNPTHLLARYKKERKQKSSYSWRWDHIGIELLQICVGEDCLFLHLTKHNSWYVHEKLRLPKALADFFLDGKFVFVAAGFGSLKEVLEGEIESIRFARSLDLNKGLELPQEHNLLKLTKVVLRRERAKFGENENEVSAEERVKIEKIKKWDELVNKMSLECRSMGRWWKAEDEEELSDRKVKCGTFQAYLAYKLGMTLAFDEEFCC